MITLPNIPFYNGVSLEQYGDSEAQVTMGDLHVRVRPEGGTFKLVTEESKNVQVPVKGKPGVTETKTVNEQKKISTKATTLSGAIDGSVCLLRQLKREGKLS